MYVVYGSTSCAERTCLLTYRHTIAIIAAVVEPQPETATEPPLSWLLNLEPGARKLTGTGSLTKKIGYLHRITVNRENLRKFRKKLLPDYQCLSVCILLNYPFIIINTCRIVIPCGLRKNFDRNQSGKRSKATIFIL